MINFVDFDAQRFGETNIANVCVQRDFNRITVPGEPHDALEKALSKFEDGIAEALRRVIEARSPCDAETWNWVLNLMSNLAARHPLVRADVERKKDEWLREETKAAVRTPEAWADRAKQMIEDGFITAEQAQRPYEELKRFADEGRYTISFTHGHLTQLEFRTQDEILAALGRRAWTILASDGSDVRFIATDRPACLLHKTGSFDPAVVPRTWDDRESIVLFPLSPGLVAHGVFEGASGAFHERPRVVPRDWVGRINVKVLQCTYTSIFAPADQYLLGPDALTAEQVLARVIGEPGRRKRGQSRLTNDG
jgi:hypothetical protein